MFWPRCPLAQSLFACLSFTWTLILSYTVHGQCVRKQKTTCLDYRDRACCCLSSLGTGPFCPLQHGHLVSCRFLNPVPQHSQPMAALLLLTLLTSGGLTVTMVTWQSLAQHGVWSDAATVAKISYSKSFFSCNDNHHKLKLSNIIALFSQDYKQ